MKTKLKSLSWILLSAILLVVFWFLAIAIFLLINAPFSVPVFETETNNHFDEADSMYLSDSSKTFFGTLSNTVDVDIIELKADVDGLFQIELSHPVSEFSSLQKLQLFLVGDGMGRSDQTLPVPIPEQMGWFVFDQMAPTPIQDDYVIGENWEDIGKIKIQIPKDGKYYLLVYDAYGQIGDYALRVLGDEPEQPMDVLRAAIGKTKLLFNF